MIAAQINQIRNLDKEQYSMLLEMCRHANSLSNSAEYHIQHFYERTGKYLSYEKNCKVSRHNPNYKMLQANVAQQTLKRRDKMYQSFFALLKEKKNGNYAADVHRPHYRKKGGYDSLLIPGKYLIRRGDFFCVPMSREFRKKHPCKEILIPIPERLKNKNIHQVEIRPAQDGTYLEAIFTYEDTQTNLGLDPENVVSVDPGVDNLAACIATNGASILIDGRQLKSINHWYNKRLALEKSRLKKENGQNWSKRLTAMSRKRTNQIRDALRKAAKLIVDFAIQNGCGTIIFGHNKGQKQEIHLGNVTNQNFVQIPHDKLRQMVKAKCEKVGIVYVDQEESYTSKASAMDGDFIPTYKHYDDPSKEPTYIFSGRRIKRGLYRNADGSLVNADVNAALNIGRKCKQNDPLHKGIRLCKGALAAPARIRIT